MAQTRSVVLVVVILLSGSAVGVLAGYRLHLTAEEAALEGTVSAQVLIEWPDDEPAFEAQVTLDAQNATVLEVTRMATQAGNLTFETTRGGLGAYVHKIGDHAAQGSCGWLYSVAQSGEEPEEGDRTAETWRVFDQDTVLWHWGCV